MLKKLGIGLLCLLLMAAAVMTAAAEDSAPSGCFTHWELPNGEKKAVAMRPVYEAVGTVTARSLGMTEDIGTIVDIDCDDSGNTYVLTDIGGLFCFNRDLELVQDYHLTDKAGEEVDFAGAKGLLACSETELYIADTANGRVLRCAGGVVEQEIGMPASSLIPSDFVFQPVKVAKDSKGYLYVLSEGSYYGALLYDPSGEFSGFYGANTVQGTLLSTLSYLWDRLTQNDIKRAKTVKSLPYQFADICIDQEDFVYTCTGMNAGGNTGQIRMLSPGGSNILKGAEDKNFGESDVVERQQKVVRQNFNSIQADGRGFIYALDETYGLLYIYDTECNLIAAFGGGRGLGTQTGVFSKACSIALSGSRLMVADSLRNTVTVFDLTEYGELLLSAQELTLKADYAGAQPLWEEIRDKDSLNRLALRGLAKASLAQEDYQAAMAYAQAGADPVTYSQALEKIQSAFITENFLWLFLGAILAVAGLCALAIVTVKRQLVLIPHARLRTMAASMIHPFRSFNDIKYKKMGSLPLAIVLAALFFLSSVLATTASNFRYTTFDASTYNSLFQLVQTVGLLALWSAANWCICTLQQGNGRLKEVFIVSAYSTLPLILYNCLSTPLSHWIASSDSTLLSGLHTLAVLVTGVMLCIGLMVVHDFSFPRVLFTAAITILFMILIVFVLFMVGILLSQFWNFAAGVFMEILQWQ